jgi:hypothetical protein
MRTVDQVRGACRIDEMTGCWAWSGARHSTNGPRIYAPVLPGGEMQSQPGRRAVWQMVTGKAIPERWRVYGTCGNMLCVNPAHIECGPSGAVGKHIAKTGAYKNKPNRIAANRATGRKRAHYTPEDVAEIMASDETIEQLATRLGLGRGPVWRIRAGHAVSYEPVGSMFSQLRRAQT